MKIFKNLRKKLLKKKSNERYGMMVYADTDSVKTTGLKFDFDLCQNCQYSIKMKNGWICGEYAATIEPYDKMCERGVKRYVGKVSVVQVGGEVQQVDVQTLM